MTINEKIKQVVVWFSWSISNRADKIFYSTDCDRPKDYIITNPGPIDTFRSNHIAWNFKYFSTKDI